MDEEQVVMTAKEYNALIDQLKSLMTLNEKIDQEVKKEIKRLRKILYLCYVVTQDYQSRDQVGKVRRIIESAIVDPWQQDNDIVCEVAEGIVDVSPTDATGGAIFYK
jgi:hypothetical protein